MKNHSCESMVERAAWSRPRGGAVAGVLALFLVRLHPSIAAQPAGPAGPSSGQAPDASSAPALPRASGGR